MIHLSIFFQNEIRGAANGSMSSIGGNFSSESNTSFPAMGDFEIGTFNAPTVQNGGLSSGTGSSTYKGTFNNSENGPQFGGGGRNIFGQNQSAQPIAGPGIRETGIIEKLLVRKTNKINLI